MTQCIQLAATGYKIQLTCVDINEKFDSLDGQFRVNESM